MLEEIYKNIPAILAFGGVILTIVGNAYLQSRKDRTDRGSADDKASAEFRDDLMAQLKQQGERIDLQDKRITELQTVASTLWNENAQVKREKLLLELELVNLKNENMALKEQLARINTTVQTIQQQTIGEHNGLS